MVIAAAKTGKDNNNNTAVITTAHPNKDNLCNLIPGVLIFAIVVMTFKLITPTLERKISPNHKEICLPGISLKARNIER